MVHARLMLILKFKQPISLPYTVNARFTVPFDLPCLNCFPEDPVNRALTLVIFTQYLQMVVRGQFFNLHKYSQFISNIDKIKKNYQIQ